MNEKIRMNRLHLLMQKVTYEYERDDTVYTMKCEMRQMSNDNAGRTRLKSNKPIFSVFNHSARGQ